jgi:hypothetical protein
VDRDSGSILSADQNYRDDLNLTCFALRQIDAPSLGDGEDVAQFDSPGLGRDFDPTLDVDRLASDLKVIPDSDSLRDPGLLVGDSVLGHAFGARDEVQRRDDFYLPDVAFQNIYLREVAAWHE